MAHLGDNTKQRSVYFCLSLVLARVVKRVEATSTSTYCVWHFSCCRSYMVFYSLATSTPSWRSVFLCIFCQFLAGRTWYATFISLWLGTRSVLTGHLFPYRCLYLFLSLSFCLCFFPSVSNFLKAMYQYCVFTSSVMFIFNLCNRG